MIKITKDHRTIRTGTHYSLFRESVYIMQGMRCCECGRITSLLSDLQDDISFHLSHRGTRGMGSGFRDDVLGPKKGQVEGGKCGKCHRQEHNQQEVVQSQPQWSRA
jgi:hypothetical protein